MSKQDANSVIKFVKFSLGRGRQGSLSNDSKVFHFVEKCGKICSTLKRAARRHQISPNSKEYEGTDRVGTCSSGFVLAFWSIWNKEVYMIYVICDQIENITLSSSSSSSSSLPSSCHHYHHDIIIIMTSLSS